MVASTRYPQQNQIISIYRGTLYGGDADFNVLPIKFDNLEIP